MSLITAYYRGPYDSFQDGPDGITYNRGDRVAVEGLRLAELQAQGFAFDVIENDTHLARDLPPPVASAPEPAAVTPQTPVTTATTLSTATAAAAGSDASTP
jgi:hypothetical protein